MSEMIEFPDRSAFREWLTANAADHGGLWLLFGKKGGPVTISANDALEEALCFGWIDGQMRSLNETTYKKYFSLRRAGSNWSEKNKALAEKLLEQGKVTALGMEKIAEAKENGQWEKPKTPAITAEEIAALAELLREYEPAHTNFLSMPPSAQKTYARGYYAAKTEAGRESRMAWMVDRLNQNLKPM